MSRSQESVQTTRRLHDRLALDGARPLCSPATHGAPALGAATVQCGAAVLDAGRAVGVPACTCTRLADVEVDVAVGRRRRRGGLARGAAGASRPPRRRRRPRPPRAAAVVARPRGPPAPPRPARAPASAGRRCRWPAPTATSVAASTHQTVEAAHVHQPSLRVDSFAWRDSVAQAAPRAQSAYTSRCSRFRPRCRRAPMHAFPLSRSSSSTKTSAPRTPRAWASARWRRRSKGGLRGAGRHQLRRPVASSRSSKAAPAPSSCRSTTRSSRRAPTSTRRC